MSRKPSRRYRKAPAALKGVCRHTAFPDRKQAEKAAGGLRSRLGMKLDPDAARVYRCHGCGFYHLTDNDKGDFDRITARYTPPKRATAAQAMRYIAGEIT